MAKELNYSIPVATDLQARNAEPIVDPANPAKKKRRNWSAGEGLYLTIQPTGVKSWNFMYRDGDKIKRLNIGRFDEAPIKGRDQPPIGAPHTLAEARVAVSNARRDRANNIDPVAKKKAAKKPAAQAPLRTVEEAGKRFIRDHCRVKNRSWREQERHFTRYINAAIGGLDIAAVTRDDIDSLLDGIMAAAKRRRDKRRTTKAKDGDGARRPGGIMANRVLSTAARFFNWLIEKKEIAANPCAGVAKPGVEIQKERHLEVDEIADVWRAADKLGAPFGYLLQTLLLTGQRRTECTRMNWSELDIDGKEWTLPAARSKNKKAHVVPLNAPMLALLGKIAESRRRAGHVFTTTGDGPVGGLGRAKTRMDKTLSWANNKPYRIHDLRHTVATYLDTLLEDDGTAAKAILNHTDPGVTRGYIHSNKAKIRRRGMRVWGRFLQDVVLVDARRAAYRKMESDDDERTEALHEALLANDEQWAAYLRVLDLSPKRRAAYTEVINGDDLDAKRTLQAALHGDDERWAAYVATLDGEEPGNVVRLATIDGVAAA